MMETHANPRRPRVLLLAHACNPYLGSESSVGWNRAVTTARYADTWVICEQQSSAEDIARHERVHGRIAGLHFEFIPRRKWEEIACRIPGVFQLPHNCWHRRAFRLARKLHRELQFDLVHQVTLCGYREPGYLWKLDAPFVWGPVGGSQNFPWRFLREAGPRGAIHESLRTVVNHAQLRFSPRVRQAVRRASVLLAANSTNQRDFAHVHGVRPVLQLETGVDRVAEAPPGRRKPGEPLRILWVGQFRPWKGLPLLLKALAGMPAEAPYRLRVLGSGRLGGSWRRLARKTGVDAHTTWMEWLPREEALRQYSWADVFMFTSLRDTSGNVVLEALAAGVPVVCLDHQGAHDMVTDACGIKIPVTTPKDVVTRLAEAIQELAGDEDRRQRLCAGALERAADYLWTRQGDRMAAVHGRVLGRSTGFEPADGQDRQDACAAVGGHE